jgi:hypothetical protein
VQFFVLDPLTKPLTESSDVVYIFYSVFTPLGKLEADFTASIASGFSNFTKPDGHMRNAQKKQDHF